MVVDFPGAILTSPTGINSKEVIVGVYNDANFANHGFLRSRDRTFTTFDPPGSTDTIPYGINSAGTIIGVANRGTGSYASRTKEKRMSKETRISSPFDGEGMVGGL